MRGEANKKENDLKKEVIRAKVRVAKWSSRL